MVVNVTDGTMIDPAGGTGGFCSAVLRQIRTQIRKRVKGRPAQERAISGLKDRIFLIDKKPRLVKLAKAAMIVSGNGHRGFVQGDSLTPISELPSQLLNQCEPGSVSLVMTNPPWSGLVNGRISDQSILKGFALGRKWEYDENGRYSPTPYFVSGGIPPEYLFVEQATNWLAPKGTLAIVLPKGILDNAEPALAVRHFLFRNYKIQAIINCHKDTFQPYTGSRGCLIVGIKKDRPGDGRQYPVFMAINRKIGQDSLGKPIYRKDDHGRPTRELDHDLDSILKAWHEFRQGRLKDSEYVFSVSAKNLDSRILRLNPQAFLPSLNESLQKIIGLDGEGFTVRRLGDGIASQIWKGTRWPRKDLYVESPNNHTYEFLTPNSIFMGGKGKKHLDLSYCEAKRKAEILHHTAKMGEIVITRSGTIGRVMIIGENLQGKILSDDLIRVWIEDLKLRALVFAFLRSQPGQDQLLRNEYGTVQQHLEPSHIADLQIPVPDDKEMLGSLLETVSLSLEAYEQSLNLSLEADQKFDDMLKFNQPNGS